MTALSKPMHLLTQSKFLFALYGVPVAFRLKLTLNLKALL
jgi:hypothetical protein